MSRLHLNPWLLVVFAGGAAYPLLVYSGMTVLPPIALVLLGLALIGMRLLGMRKNTDVKIWEIAFLIASFGLAGMLFLNAEAAVQAYPVVVSLSAASVFGLSLWHPPTMAERIACLTETYLPPGGVIYSRRVTVVWVAFLLVNALISTELSIWGTLAQWALWNGLVSYLLIGALFIGEMVVRRMVCR